jgi:hypothetical protein
MSRNEALLHGLGFLCAVSAYAAVHHVYFFELERTGMRVRIALCSLVYR